MVESSKELRRTIARPNGRRPPISVVGVAQGATPRRDATPIDTRPPDANDHCAAVDNGGLLLRCRRRNALPKPIVRSGRRAEPRMPKGDTSKSPESRNARPSISPRATSIAASEAERRAWATVDTDDGGGKKPGGSGRGRSAAHPATHKGGRLDGMATSHRSAADRSASARNAAATRKRNAERAAASQPGPR